MYTKVLGVNQRPDTSNIVIYIVSERHTTVAKVFQVILTGNSVLDQFWSIHRKAIIV